VFGGKWEKPHSFMLRNNQHLASQLGQLKWSVHVDPVPVLILFSLTLLSRSNSCGLLPVYIPSPLKKPL